MLCSMHCYHGLGSEFFNSSIAIYFLYCCLILSCLWFCCMVSFSSNKLLLLHRLTLNILYNLNKNNIDDKFVQETIYSLYYLYNYTNEQDTNLVSTDHAKMIFYNKILPIYRVSKKEVYCAKSV